MTAVKPRFCWLASLIIIITWASPFTFTFAFNLPASRSLHLHVHRPVRPCSLWQRPSSPPPPAAAATPTRRSVVALNTDLLGPAVGANSFLAVVGIILKQGALTSEGLAHAWALGVLLWSTLGGKGWLVCVIYLVFGSLVTKIKMKEKEALGIAEKRGGARGPENVWGAAASGAICALATVIFPQWKALLQVGYVASLATKLSDTFASEVGKAYGKRTFLVTTLKPVPRGTEGAVSLEGTLAGVVGSLIMGGAGILLGQMSVAALGWTALAAFVANYVESLLGAMLQNDKHPWATNEVVNFINTAVGAGIAMAAMRAVAART